MITAESLVQSAKDSINKLVASSRNEIQKFIDIAALKSVNITECVVENKKVIATTTDLGINEVLTCISKSVEQAETILDNTKAEIRKYCEEADQDISKLRNCGIGFSAIPCHAGTLKDLTLLITGVPGKIAHIMIVATQTIVAIENDLTKCAADVIQLISSKIASIVKETNLCIEKKIEANSNKST